MLIRDNYQNFKTYQLPKAQLIIADILHISLIFRTFTV